MHALPDQRFVVKVFKGSIQETQDEVLREATVLHLAQAHPHLPLLADMLLLSLSGGPGQASWALVLEHCLGGDLHRRIQGGPVGPRLVRDVVTQVAAALGFLHGQCLAHGDLKSDNVLLGPWPGREETEEWTRAGGHACLVKLADLGRVVQAARPGAKGDGGSGAASVTTSPPCSAPFARSAGARIPLLVCSRASARGRPIRIRRRRPRSPSPLASEFASASACPFPGPGSSPDPPARAPAASPLVRRFRPCSLSPALPLPARLPQNPMPPPPTSVPLPPQGHTAEEFQSGWEMPIGCVGWRAPEVLFGEQFFTQAGDVFALGCVMFYAAGGRWQRLDEAELAAQAASCTGAPVQQRQVQPPADAGLRQQAKEEAFLTDLIQVMGRPGQADAANALGLPGCTAQAPPWARAVIERTRERAKWGVEIARCLGPVGCQLLEDLLGWDRQRRPSAQAVAEAGYGSPGGFPLAASSLPCPWHPAAGPWRLEGVGTHKGVRSLPPETCGALPGKRGLWAVRKGEVAAEVLEWMQQDPALAGGAASLLADRTAAAGCALEGALGPGYADPLVEEKSPGKPRREVYGPSNALKKKWTGFAGTGRTVLGTARCATRGGPQSGTPWTPGGSMCGLPVKQPLPLRRVNGFFEAFLQKNMRAIQHVDRHARVTLQRRFPVNHQVRRTARFREFFEDTSGTKADVFKWFLRMAEVHVSSPLVWPEANPTNVFGEATAGERAPGPLPRSGSSPAEWPCWHEPRHNDGAGSVFHMSLTLFGRRDVHLEQGPGSDADAKSAADARQWPAAQAAGPASPDDALIACTPGTLYLGMLTGPTHQVHHRRPDPDECWQGKWAVTVQFRTGLFHGRADRLRNANLGNEFFVNAQQAFRTAFADPAIPWHLPTLEERQAECAQAEGAAAEETPSAAPAAGAAPGAKARSRKAAAAAGKPSTGRRFSVRALRRLKRGAA